MDDFIRNSRPNLTRRDVLRGFTAGVAATLGEGLLAGSKANAQPLLRGTNGPKADAELTPGSLPKEFSLGEMERRWRKVRQRMKEAKLDCLIVPVHREGAMLLEYQNGDADVKWLVQIPAEWVVLPLQGAITAITTNQINPLLAEGPRDRGFKIVFAPEGLWSPSIIDTLRKDGMGRARIGVGDIVDVFRNPEGGVHYTTYQRVREAFPHARFESAVDLLMRVKLVRSAEEIAVIEKAGWVSEAGLAAMMKTARPGVVHREVWLAMYNAMVNASGEVPMRVSLQEGAPGFAGMNRPMENVFRPGGILSQEISGFVLGNGSQVNHSVCLGHPAPADWHSTAQYCLDVFHELVAWIAPGKGYKEFCDFYLSKVKSRGVTGGVVLHTAGGGDGPRSGPNRKEGSDLVFEPGMIFTVKPSVPLKHGGGIAQFGDPVLVTKRGARRLGRRKLDVVTLGA